MAANANGSHLRAVAPDEKPKRRRHTVFSAATSGDRLDLERATRDRIAKAITDPKCPPRDLAALTKRLGEVMDKIAVLEAAAVEEGSGSDATDDDTFDASAI